MNYNHMYRCSCMVYEDGDEIDIDNLLSSGYHIFRFVRTSLATTGESQRILALSANSGFHRAIALEIINDWNRAPDWKYLLLE